MLKRFTPFSDRSVRLSALACAVGFGGFFLWSALAKLDEGVTASGQVVVQTDRKRVQHLEGGIVRKLSVREGQRVAQGDVLVELAPLQSETARDEVAQELAVQSGTLARLNALRNGEESVDFTVISEIGIADDIATDIRERQRTLFEQQRAARDAELTVLETRRSSAEGRVRDLASEIAATRRALDTAREDLALRQELLSENLETVSNVSQLQREVSRFEADLSRLTGQRNEASKTTEQLVGEIEQLKAQFQETIGQQIVEAQSRALAAGERLAAAGDRLARTTVTAPQSGIVLNLAQTTLGGVVTPGETIMEIVPDNDDLIVSVRLTPTDRDAVHAGQRVEAQLTAYKSFIAPRLPGEVLGVSADLKQDELNGAYYYEARISLDPTGLPDDTAIEILPGMPVETFIASGQSRTFLDYVFEPILRTFDRGTRMS